MSSHADKHASESGYEKKDVNLRMTFIIAAIIVIFIAVCLVWLRDVFISQKEEMMYNVVLKPESISLRDLRAKETEVLTTYKLLDPAKGVYRIPIDRAMELMADEAYRLKSSGPPPTK